MSWPRDVKLREKRHPFLADTSLMRKQTCTWDYQRWIKHFSLSHSLDVFEFQSELCDSQWLFTDTVGMNEKCHKLNPTCRKKSIVSWQTC